VVLVRVGEQRAAVAQAAQPAGELRAEARGQVVGAHLVDREEDQERGARRRGRGGPGGRAGGARRAGARPRLLRGGGARRGDDGEAGEHAGERTEHRSGRRRRGAARAGGAQSGGASNLPRRVRPAVLPRAGRRVAAG
jgi:hypothetical protein